MGRDSNAVITGPGPYVRADGGTAYVLRRSSGWYVVLHGAGVQGGDLFFFYAPDGQCNIGHRGTGGRRPDGEIIVCPADQWMTPPAARPNVPDRTVVDVWFAGETKRFTVDDINWDALWRWRHRGAWWRVPDPRRAEVKTHAARPIWPHVDRRDAKPVHGVRPVDYASGRQAGRSTRRRFVTRDVLRQGTIADVLAHSTGTRIDRLGVVRDRLEPGDVAELRDGMLYRYEGEQQR